MLAILTSAELRRRDEIGWQYVAANDEVKRQLADLLEKAASTAVAGEVRTELLMKLKDAWLINAEWNKGQHSAAVRDFLVKIVAEFIVETFGTPALTKTLDILKLAAAVETAYWFGFFNGK